MLGHGAASLLGSPWSLLALSFAALADTKDDGADARETALDFAFVESMVFLAVVASPAGAGYVAGTYGERAAFALAAAVGLVSLLVHATMRDATKRAGRRDWVAYTPVGGLRYFCRDAHHGLVGLCCFLHWTGMRARGARAREFRGTRSRAGGASSSSCRWRWRGSSAGAPRRRATSSRRSPRSAS